jgi:archaellin
VLKFRIGLAEWPWFSKEDAVTIHVAPSSGSTGLDIPTKYIECADLDDAKVKLYAAVDKLLDHKKHMDELKKACENKQARLKKDLQEMQSVDELSIGPSKTSDRIVTRKSDELLDLMGDVLGLDENGNKK